MVTAARPKLPGVRGQWHQQHTKGIPKEDLIGGKPAPGRYRASALWEHTDGPSRRGLGMRGCESAEWPADGWGWERSAELEGYPGNVCDMRRELRSTAKSGECLIFPTHGCVRSEWMNQHSPTVGSRKSEAKVLDPGEAEAGGLLG